MLTLDAEDVRAALPMRDAIALMKKAFATLARGDATVPLRTHLSAPVGAGVTLVMPARVDGGSPSLAVKIVSVFGDNPDHGLARSQAVVVVCDPATGRPIALLEGSALTAIRTAAASGAATDLLARPSVDTVAILGAGVQARSHAEAMCCVRPPQLIRVYAPRAAVVDRFVESLARAPWCGCRVERADSAGAAVRGADIICATTTSSQPVFGDADVGPDTHINAVGTYTPSAREIEGATVARSWVVVDDRAAAWAEAGDLILARGEGRIGAEHVRAELGELVLDSTLRPRDGDRPTLFKSVGVAVQDAVAAAAILQAAEERGLGTAVPWHA